MLNVWNCQGFKIQTLLYYNAIFEGYKKFIDNKKTNYLLELTIQWKMKYIFVLYKSTNKASNYK